ncbi:MAG: hypothetical protein UR81_C0003G0008 [Candidatus Levybacteria bacterium GW2011_GWB1_35_5]|nr:MAG: hypothetical protein UR81_C0003G0008 [Candidatus Levybacteria bacterium GW2011_GWB1_35_5]
MADEIKEEVLPHKKLNPLAQELIQMARRDQKMRFDHQNPKVNTPWEDNIDRDNVQRLKDIIEEIGWPTISKVGELASYSAWLIAQHADHDVEFMKSCLPLLGKAHKNHDVNPTEIAYLTDRIAVRSGELQVYGTQLHQNENGEKVIDTIKDMGIVDQRRAKMELEPLDTFKKRLSGEIPPVGYDTSNLTRFELLSIELTKGLWV